jgi:protein SCO1/2
VEAFHARFLALRGSLRQTRQVAQAYQVTCEKVPARAGGGAYAIDPTSFTYALNTAGRFAGYFPPGTSASRIAERLRALAPLAPGGG